MSKYLLPIFTLAIFCMPELAYASAEQAANAANEAGKIPPGDHWDKITAAYVLTWGGIIGYSISLLVRRR